MIRATGLLDASGNPMPPSTNGHARRDLAGLISSPRTRRNVEARYDAAIDSDETKNLWARTDYFDADLSNNRVARQRLVRRSRYEVDNNGYSDGIAQTYAS